MERPLVTPDKIVAELVRLARADAQSTQGLKDLTHDKICRKVESQLELIGDYFLKYHQVTYHVQGPRDQGVDVLLRLSGETPSPKFVAFQIKSYAEIDDRKNDLAKLIKAGLHDTRQHYDSIDRYYVFLCGDPILHEKRITSITAEFTKSNDVVMVFPAFAKNFLDIDETTISSTVDHFLRSEDYVLKQAKEELGREDEVILRNTLFCLFTAWNSDEDDLDTSRLTSFGMSASEIGAFENKLLITNPSGRVKIMHHQFPAVRAMFYDMQVRYGYETNTLIEHLIKLLNR